MRVTSEVPFDLEEDSRALYGDFGLGFSGAILDISKMRIIIERSKLKSSNISLPNSYTFLNIQISRQIGK